MESTFGMTVSISSLLVDSLALFNDLVTREDLIAHDAEAPKTLWIDELGRLRIWAANIGAHQTGQSSLDYRLRDASHIKDQVVRLLKRLRLSLVDLQEALDEHPEEAEDQLSEDEDTTEVEQIYNGLVEAINSLFQMSMLIRRPARHDRLLGTSKEDSLSFEPYDRKHVHEKYPQAAGFIVDRLGTAISRRRADLKYRERHHAKLSQGINKLHAGAHNESQSIRDGQSTVFSETIATEFKEPNIQFDDAGSNSGLSQTSYAPTLLEGGKAMTVPPPPKESANEQPFECPYCFFITTIKNKRSWARHVFRDIMPYICVFTGCSTPNSLYESRREWYHHLTDSHLVRSEQVELQQCPLCHERGFSVLSFQRHLGRHLEELALFAIPRLVDDDDIDSDKSRHSSRRNTPFQAEQPNLSSDEESDSLEWKAVGLDDPNTPALLPYPLRPLPPDATPSPPVIDQKELVERVEAMLLKEKEERQARDDAREAYLKAEADAIAAATERAASDLKIASEAAAAAAAAAKAEAEANAAEEAARIREDMEKKLKEAEEALASAKKQAEEAAARAEEKAKENEEIKKSISLPPPPEEKKAPIRFHDAIGRKFNFPFHLCTKWTSMEELIRQAFEHVEEIGPHVHKGHYDLMGPDSGIIMPSAWDSVIEPDMKITMHMWPLPEHKEEPAPPPPILEDDGILNLDDLLAPEKEVKTEDKPAAPKAPKKASRPSGLASWMLGNSKPRGKPALKGEKKPDVAAGYQRTEGYDQNAYDR